MQARRLAEFCKATGLPPAVYRSLTQYEYNAFIDVWNEE